MGFGIWGLWFEVQGLRLRVWGFGVLGLETETVTSDPHAKRVLVLGFGSGV